MLSSPWLLAIGGVLIALYLGWDYLGKLFSSVRVPTVESADERIQMLEQLLPLKDAYEEQGKEACVAAVKVLIEDVLSDEG